MTTVINFNEARAKRLWRELVHAYGGNLPNGVPLDPEAAYGDAWVGWCAWFGVATDKPFDVAATKARFEEAIDNTWAEIAETAEGGAQ